MNAVWRLDFIWLTKSALAASRSLDEDADITELLSFLATVALENGANAGHSSRLPQ